MSVTVALLAFIAAGTILIVTPGPDTALALRTAAVEGPRRGAYTAAGICFGLLFWGLAAVLGIAAVIAASHLAYMVLRVIGAAWLVWLGLHLLLRHRSRTTTAAAGVTVTDAGARAWFMRGLVSNLTNPKVGVFFVTFLPQFVAPGQVLLPRLLELGLIFAIIGWTWMIVYGLLISRIRDFITAPRVRQWMQRVTGVVLLGFGARLALERI